MNHLTYAADTSVSVEKSRSEIQTLLSKAGADTFGYKSDRKGAIILFAFKEREVMFRLPLPDPGDAEFTTRTYIRAGVRRTGEPNRPDVAYKLWEQACRSKWRSLYLCIKAKLEAVSAGITTFEKEFLAQFVLPGGGTIGDRIIPQLEQIHKTGKSAPLSLTEKVGEFTNV